MKKILHLFLKNTFAARNACLAVFVVLMFTAGLNAQTNALAFGAATPDYVTIPRSISDDFTIEYWIETTQVAASHSQWYGGQGLVDGEAPGGANDFGTALVDGGKICFGVGSVPADVTIKSTTNTINNGSWVHVAFTREKSTGTMKLYVNGALEATGSNNAGTTLNAPPSLKIGALQTLFPPSSQADGTIDELRLWDLVRTQSEISGNMNVELAPQANLVALYHFNQGIAGGNNTGITTLTDASGNSNTGTLTNFTLTGTTSNWVIGATALPVELVSFTVKRLDKIVRLDWQTASETNNRGFEIQRGTDGQRWDKLGFVAGNGTSTETHDYAFLDEKPLPSVNYYRLRQTDFDGGEEFSKVVSVDFRNLQDFRNLRIAPNPVINGELTLFLPEDLKENLPVQLFSQTGQLVYSATLSGGAQSLNVSDLAAGIYSLKIWSGTAQFFEKIVVQH